MKAGCFFKIVLAMLVVSTAVGGACLVSAEPDMEWNETYGGSSTDYGRSMAQTSDGGYIIAGYTDSYGTGGDDFYLVKTDSNGVKSWSEIYGGGADDRGYSVAQTSDGGYIIVGETRTFPIGSYDVYLVKTDVDGVESWSKTFGGANEDCGYSVDQTMDGGYIIVGYTGADVYLIKTDSSGTETWSNTFDRGPIDYGLCVTQTSDAGYIITGASCPPPFPVSMDVWLIKTDSSGAETWNKTYGGAGFDRGYSVVQTGDGGYIIAGETSSSGAGLHDVYLIKTDSSGTETWSKTFGGASDDCGYSVDQTMDGGYIIVGYTGDDVYLIKTGSDGAESWSKTMGGAGSEVGRSVAQTGDGGYIVAGYTDSYGAGNGDVWLIKVEVPPSPAPPARENKPNPGTVFIDRNVSFSDCVRFYFIIRDMNKTAANYCFTLTITDTDDQLVYARNYTVRRRTNWYLFYLCKDRFPPGTYDVYATACNWSQEQQFKTH